MIAKFIEDEICYTGRELTSHWAYRRFGLLGDSIVAFRGPCDLPVERMADLEDILSDAPIHSTRMLHFIVEHFGISLEISILRQRLLICLIAEELNRDGAVRVIRRGDDLYSGEGKLSVSIAVQSPVSTMIHAGLNVVTEGTPVRTAGLSELGVAPEGLAEEILVRYGEEIDGIARARCKVRGVP
ncbi:MAG: DUF366 family protein [Deltaproteobacteria bacterium]|nr:DUF366 family protein [Deltaproteobacteria bacterium]